MLATPVMADTIKGRVTGISKKAQTIKVTPKGKPSVIVRVDDSTQYEKLNGFKDVSMNVLVKVEIESGKAASKITKVVFGLPAGAEINIEELEKLMKSDKDFVLADARPTKKFGPGHLPGSISVFPEALTKNPGLLPDDKSKLVVFYCGGETCPFTSKGIKAAQKLGYKNLKGFQAGMPAWKKAKKPVHASAGWVEKSLGKHLVLLDARGADKQAKGHIKGAVSVDVAQLKDIQKAFMAEKKKATAEGRTIGSAPRLPGASDEKAPIVLYADGVDEAGLLKAYVTLRKWKYKSVAILEGGFAGWKAKGRAVASGALAKQIQYVRKPVPGAVTADAFAKLVKDKNAVVLDVRDESEAGGGIVKGAKSVSLDQLEAKLAEIPKDKQIVAYCMNGIRAQMAYELLISKGYKKVGFLNESIIVNPDGSYTVE
jgi:rhodanese-related sulfurtransferase